MSVLLDKAVGRPITENANTFTLAAGVAQSAVLGDGFYDLCFNTDINFELRSTATAATTTTGTFVKAGTIYSFLAPPGVDDFSVISQAGEAGYGAVWPKRLS